MSEARPRTPQPHPTDAFRPDVEGLRAIAVLLVVVYHARLFGVSGGFVGVDIFFVLSGFLITGILVRQVERTGRVDLVGFYARRARRLLPAAALMLLVVLVASLILFSSLERLELSLSGVATALYSSNVFFALRATDYFAAGAETNPLLHTWSLSVEEQFYLVWPLLVWGALRVGRTRRGLGILVGIVSAVSFAVSVWLTRKSQPWAFFSTPPRAWEFGIGGMSWLVPDPTTAAGAQARRTVGWIGLLAVLASAWVIRSGTTFPGIVVLLPTIGTVAALIAGGNDGQSGVGRLLGVAPLQWIGRRSYAWYLWHWPALIFTLAFVPRASPVVRVACVLGALAVAALSTALVENPIRFHPALVRRPRRSLVLAAMLTIGVAAAAYASYRQAAPRGELFAAVARGQSAIIDGACYTDYLDTRPKECTFGDERSDTTVVLFGDSHAAQWFTPLERMAKARRWRLVTLVKYSCPAARTPVNNRRLKRPYTECATWREAALRRIAALRPRALVIGQFTSPSFIGLAPDGSPELHPYERWRDAMRSTLAMLDSAAVPTLLMRDTPSPGKNVPECLARAEHWNRSASECATPRARALETLAFGAEQAAAAGLAHVTIADLSDLICGPTMCDPVRDGTIVFRDRNHLSDAYATRLAPALGERLVPLVREAR